MKPFEIKYQLFYIRKTKTSLQLKEQKNKKNLYTNLYINKLDLVFFN